MSGNVGSKLKKRRHRSYFLPTPPCTAPTPTLSVDMPCQAQRCAKRQNISNCNSDCEGTRKVRPVTRGARRQLYSDRSLLRPLSTCLQLQIRLSTPLPQLLARPVRGRPLLLCRPTSRRESFHSDFLRRASLWKTPSLHLRPRELARSDARCRGNQVHC